MKLEEIGFYTLCDKRAEEISESSPMWRCEMILTDKCNFSCSYCRKMRPECQGRMATAEAIHRTNLWAKDGLKHIRYSGGEPTLHTDLIKIVKNAKSQGIDRIALSTNGSASHDLYLSLVRAGVNDFSISLDACCSTLGDAMSGSTGQYNNVITNIRLLSRLTYVTVGVVITEDNLYEVNETIEFAHNLGVADIRIISAAQFNEILESVTEVSDEILDAHPILKYRVNNMREERNVRGLSENDSHKCYLLNDDSVIGGDYHFPCIIYMREGGDPVGKVNQNMRKDRIEFFETFDTHLDPICQKNCLDVCIDFNNRCESFKTIEV